MTDTTPDRGVDWYYSESVELAGPSDPRYPAAARTCFTRNRHEVDPRCLGRCGNCGAELGRAVYPVVPTAANTEES